MKISKTKKENAKRITYYRTIIATLTSSLQTLDTKDVEIIENEIEINLKKIEFLTSRKSINYNFKSGGWNSCYAATIEEAIAGEIERWGSRLSHGMDLETFRQGVDSETEALMNNFY